MPASEFTIRLQQTSGMVMAKGVEDCAFYRWTRLTSLTEVGGEPSEFSLSPLRNCMRSTCAGCSGHRPP